MTIPDRYALYRDGRLVKAFPTRLQCVAEALERGWAIELAGFGPCLQTGTEIRPIEETPHAS